jgi:hypothetical protein
MLEMPKLSDSSLVYMYGLSDFWVDMFKDTQLVEALLSSQTIQLAEAYSYFLQRSAGISLTDIQDKYQTRIKLLLLSEDDIVTEGDYTSFKIDPSLVSISKISNRPILPTSTLTYGIHFDIDENVLKFHKPIGELKFPVRYKSDGTWQYAIWMSDVEINERWIDNTFGRLVGFTEDDAIFNYKSFLEGVYFLYTNGPNISNIERGVNLAMGMPYARETEEVLDVAKDEISGNWIVLTSNYSYEIPYAYQPDISVGDIITENSVLSTWVEIKDYSNSGAWWYQIYLPREVLGEDVDPYTLGLAVEGSPGDGMMNTFLKHHMFEVLITQPSSDITSYNTTRNLVLQSKPEYTYPVFVWKASIGDEYIEMEEELTYNYKSSLRDTCISPPSIRYMDRSDSNSQFSRGINWYNRVQGSTYAASLLGSGDWPGNGGWAPQFESISDRYKAYMAVTFRNRGDRVSSSNRSTIIRGWRGVNQENFDGITWRVKAADVYGSNSDLYVSERNLTPLYLMNLTEFTNKMLSIDSRFRLGSRKKVAISGLNLVEAYDKWMIRNSDVTSDESEVFNFFNSPEDLDGEFSIFTHQTYVPKRSDMYDMEGNPITDGTLLITRTTDNSWACQWVRTRVAVAPTMFPIEDQDHTRAIETYSSSSIGSDIHGRGVSINSEVGIVQTRELSEGPQDAILIIDGLYTPISEYTVRVDKSRYESIDYQNEGDNYIELDTLDRSFLEIPNPPEVLGYTVYDKAPNDGLYEETLSPELDGSYLLSKAVNREGILVISSGKFNFDYTISGSVLEVSGVTGDIIVRYVTHVSEEVLPSGFSVYTLSQDACCKIFIGDSILEDWAYVRSGATIELPADTVDDLIVRYSGSTAHPKVSNFNRSTVERNKARFLMDRSRENGEYSDNLGNTVYLNRSGVPVDSSGNTVEEINVIRRLL